MKQVIHYYGHYRKLRKQILRWRNDKISQLINHSCAWVNRSVTRKIGLAMILIVLAISFKDSTYDMLCDPEQQIYYARKGFKILAKRLTASGHTKCLKPLKKVFTQLKKFHRWSKKMQLDFDEFIDT